MSKQTGTPPEGPQPISEEMLDKSIGFLDERVGPVLERIVKSRLVLLPVGLSLRIGLRVAARLLGRPPTPPASSTPSTSSSSSSSAPSSAPRAPR